MNSRHKITSPQYVAPGDRILLRSSQQTGTVLKTYTPAWSKKPRRHIELAIELAKEVQKTAKEGQELVLSGKRTADVRLDDEEHLRRVDFGDLHLDDNPTPEQWGKAWSRTGFLKRNPGWKEEAEQVGCGCGPMHMSSCPKLSSLCILFLYYRPRRHAHTHILPHHLPHTTTSSTVHDMNNISVGLVQSHTDVLHGVYCTSSVGLCSTVRVVVTR